MCKKTKPRGRGHSHNCKHNVRKLTNQKIAWDRQSLSSPSQVSSTPLGPPLLHAKAAVVLTAIPSCAASSSASACVRLKPALLPMDQEGEQQMTGIKKAEKKKLHQQQSQNQTNLSLGLLHFHPLHHHDLELKNWEIDQIVLKNQSRILSQAYRLDLVLWSLFQEKKEAKKCLKRTKRWSNKEMKRIQKQRVAKQTILKNAVWIESSSCFNTTFYLSRANTCHLEEKETNNLQMKRRNGRLGMTTELARNREMLSVHSFFEHSFFFQLVDVSCCKEKVDVKLPGPSVSDCWFSLVNSQVVEWPLDHIGWWQSQRAEQSCNGFRLWSRFRLGHMTFPGVVGEFLS